jgi:hypothetical protein
MIMTIEIHWKNPWSADAIVVPIEELVECAGGIGQYYRDHDGSSFIMTKENMLKHWKSRSNKHLDAYILPCPSGFHCIGIRYGNEHSQYLSPMADQTKVKLLLAKYM